MNVKVITDIEELPKFSITEPIFADIETQGLYINTRLIQFYQPTTDDTIYILDLAPMSYDRTEYIDNLDRVKSLMLQWHLVWYNASYDLGTLNIVPNKTDDLFYAVKSAYPEFMEFGLAKVTDKLPYSKGLYAGLDKAKLQKQGFVLGAYLSQQQLKYSAIDVLALAKMWEDKRIQNIIQNNMAYKVDIKSLEYAIMYQQNGLIVDLDKRTKLLVEAMETVERLTNELPYYDKDTKTFNFDMYGEPMKPNSYQQVRAYLGTDKSDHDALVEYSMSDKPLAHKANVIIDVKRAKKEASYLESINFPKMYTRFNVAGAITGRFTSSGGDLIDGFNAQQIPRQFQGLFKHPTEDTVVVGLDYSTLELRLACTIFNEPYMYKQLMNGEDLHTAMAMKVSGKKLHPDGVLGSDGDRLGVNVGDYVTKADRTTAKGVNFGFVFGMSAKTFKNYAFTGYGINYPLDECTKLRTAYFTMYPNFKKYHDYVWNNYSKPEFVYTTALGRRVKPRLGTDGINGPVQGSGAETTKLATHYLIKSDMERLGVKDFRKTEVIKYIINVVHDAIYLRVPKADEEIWKERLSKAMVKGWEEISKSKMFNFKDIPMPVEV